MSQAVACDYCEPYTVEGSRGVSAEATILAEVDQEVQRRELERAAETKLSRQIRAQPALLDLVAQAGREDWDGEGAPALSTDAIAQAYSLIGQIPEAYPMPEIYAEKTGEVGLEWYIAPYRVLLLSVPGDGFVFYNALFGFKNADYGSKRITGRMDQKIIALLEELYRKV